jgi:hypothetical protein
MAQPILVRVKDASGIERWAGLEELVGIPDDGGGGEPPPIDGDLTPILARLASLEGRQGRVIDLSEQPTPLVWRQNSVLMPDGSVASNVLIPYNTPAIPNAILKTVCQFWYEPKGMSDLFLQLVFGPGASLLLPDEPPGGGEWEFALPCALRQEDALSARFRGYARDLAWASSAGHHYVMWGGVEIRTADDPAFPGTDLRQGWVAARFDRSDVDQPGVCNKRHPLLHDEMWGNGCIFGFHVRFPSE